MTATTQGLEELAIPDLSRRQANAVRIGTVMEVDPAGYRVRVKSGAIETDWIKWGLRRAKGTRSWSAPVVGEQVVMAAPSGDLRQAVVICAIPQDAAPPAGTTGDVDRTIYPDGAVVEYNHASHELLVTTGGTTVKASPSEIRLEVGGSSIVITSSAVTINSGGLTHNGKNVGSTHIHSGVTTGGGNTMGPV